MAEHSVLSSSVSHIARRLRLAGADVLQAGVSMTGRWLEQEKNLCIHRHRRRLIDARSATWRFAAAPPVDRMDAGVVKKATRTRYGFYLPTRAPTATCDGVLALARQATNFEPIGINARRPHQPGLRSLRGSRRGRRYRGRC